MKLMFGALIRAAERWKSIKVTEFERRQLSAVRKELAQEYEIQVDLNRKPSKGATQTKISRALRLDRFSLRAIRMPISTASSQIARILNF